MSLLHEANQLYAKMLQAVNENILFDVTEEHVETVKKLMGTLKEWELSVAKNALLRQEMSMTEDLVLIEITDYEDERYWYKDMVGEKLVAFGISDDNAVWCCHKNNTDLNVATINEGHYRFVQGNKKQLWNMD